MWVREASSRFTISHFHFFTVKHFHALTLSPRWARGTGPLFTTSHFNFHFLTFTFSLSLSDSYFHCHPGEPEKLAPLRLVASWLLSSFPGWTSYSKGNLQNGKCRMSSNTWYLGDNVVSSDYPTFSDLWAMPQLPKVLQLHHPHILPASSSSSDTICCLPIQSRYLLFYFVIYIL